MSNQLSIKKVKVSIDTLMRRVTTESVVFLPIGNIRIQDTATKAIAMILMGADLPLIFATEDRNGVYTLQYNGVILYAINQFVKGHIPLKETTLFDGISGKEFDDLPNQYQNRIYDHVMLFNKCIPDTTSPKELQQVKALIDDLHYLST